MKRTDIHRATATALIAAGTLIGMAAPAVAGTSPATATASEVRPMGWEHQGTYTSQGNCAAMGIALVSTGFYSAWDCDYDSGHSVWHLWVYDS